jgi:predicted aconitase with swiveling domain
MSKVIINCKPAVSGHAEGEALIISQGLSFLEGVNMETGEFNEEAYPELKGENLRGKIVIYPYGKGSCGDTIRLWRTCMNGVGPAGIINRYADPILVQGAMLADIPLVYEPDKDPLEMARSGDRVTINNGEVTIQSSVNA